MKPHKIRIIGGKFRGRKIPVPDIPEVRPTTDRARETLFNWLAPHIVNSTTLDLFAGTGILSFEALSRGARKAILVDQSMQVVKHLQQQATSIGLTKDQFHIIQKAIPATLNLSPESIDIVFLDPPFRENLIIPTCSWLIKNNWLKNKALIYIETEKKYELTDLPNSFELIKTKIVGQVHIYLFELNAFKHTEHLPLSVDKLILMKS